MTINLKPEQERIIRAEIESGQFRSTDEAYFSMGPRRVSETVTF
jgi:hypothetical protein